MSSKETGGGSAKLKGKMDNGIKRGALKPSLHQFWISRVHREQNGKLW